jgi:hypothetical protein
VKATTPNVSKQTLTEFFLIRFSIAAANALWGPIDLPIRPGRVPR